MEQGRFGEHSFDFDVPESGNFDLNDVCLDALANLSIRLYAGGNTVAVEILHEVRSVLKRLHELGFFFSEPRDENPFGVPHHMKVSVFDQFDRKGEGLYELSEEEKALQKGIDASCISLYTREQRLVYLKFFRLSFYPPGCARHVDYKEIFQGLLTMKFEKDYALNFKYDGKDFSGDELQSPEVMERVKTFIRSFIFPDYHSLAEIMDGRLETSRAVLLVQKDDLQGWGVADSETGNDESEGETQDE